MKDFDFIDQYEYTADRGIRYTNSKGTLVLRKGTLFYVMGKGTSDYLAIDIERGPFFKVSPTQIDTLDSRVEHVKDVWPPKKRKILDTTIEVDTRGVKQSAVPSGPELESRFERYQRDQMRPTFNGVEKKSRIWFKKNQPDLVKWLTSTFKRHLDDGRTDESWERVKPVTDRTDAVLVETYLVLSNKKHTVRVTFGFSQVAAQPYFGLSVYFDDKVYSDYHRFLKLPLAAALIDLVGKSKQDLKKKFGLILNVVKPQIAHVNVSNFSGTIVSWSAKL